MKKITKSLLLIMLVCAVMFTDNVPVAAATKAPTKASVTTVKKDLSKTYRDKKGHKIKLNYYYKRVSVKGSSAAVKKINKTLKAASDEFMSKKRATNLANIVNFSLPLGYSGQTFTDTATSKVTYNKKGILSIAVTVTECNGGTRTVDTYGYTFRLKDGKLLKLTNVCSGGTNAIKTAIWNGAKKAGVKDMSYTFTKSKINPAKTDFYVKSDSSVVICLNSNVIGSNSWLNFTIKRSLKSSSVKTSTLADGIYEAEFVPKAAATNSSYAKNHGNVYKASISGNYLTIYGNFSKNGKKYSSAKRVFEMDPIYMESAMGKAIINNIKSHITKNAYCSFTIENNMITYFTFAG